MSTIESAPAEADLSAAVALAAEVGRHWRRQGIRCSQVRDAGLDRHGVFEIDVLVHPDDVVRAEHIAADLGLGRLRAWGRSPHRFLVGPAFGRAKGDANPAWVKLDLVTDLCFGRYHEVRTDSATGCLAASVAGQGPLGWRLSPADEFASLLLHCILDKQFFPKPHRVRLAALAPWVRRSGRFAPAGARPDARAPEWSEMIDAVTQRRWSSLLAMGPRLRSAVAAGSARETEQRRRLAQVARRATKLRHAMSARGKSVAVVGTDGTGKSTLVAAVAKAVPVDTRVLYAGTYRSRPGHRDVPLVSTAVVAARLVATQSASMYHRARGRLVLLDRHPLEAVAGDPASRSAKAQLRRRLLASLVARPDLLVVLDAPTDVICGRLEHPDPLRVEHDRADHLEIGRRRGSVVVDAACSATAVRDETVGLVWRSVTGLPGPPPGSS